MTKLKADAGTDPKRPRNPLEAPTTPDGTPPRPPSTIDAPDVSIKEPPEPDGTPTPVETPDEDR